MHYDESSRRLNLLAGLAVGAVLGAGLALLFVPGDGVADRVRVVARGACGLGRAAGNALGDARDRARRLRAESSAEDELDHDDVTVDDDASDEVDDASAADGPRVRRMARRRFRL